MSINLALPPTPPAPPEELATPPSSPNNAPSEAAPKRYDANMILIRRRLADEHRTKTKRRWRLLF